MKVREIMQRNVTAIRESESLAVAQQLMRWAEIRHLPVLRSSDGRVVGMLSERDMLHAAAVSEASPLFMDRPVSAFMTTPVEHIHPNAEIADAAADMTTKKLGCLPVIDAGELVGILTRGDVLSVLAQCPPRERAPERTPRVPPIAAIMYPEPIAMRAGEPLLAVAARMASTGARHACVVDDEGRVIGMLSDRDVRRVIGDPQRALEIDRLPSHVRELRIESAMRRELQTIDQDEPFTNALPLLATGRIGALPVVDGHGRLRGIVSYVDLLKALAMYVPTAS